jgi:hypothetical protein
MANSHPKKDSQVWSKESTIILAYQQQSVRLYSPILAKLTRGVFEIHTVALPSWPWGGSSPSRQSIFINYRIIRVSVGFVSVVFQMMDVEILQ